MEVELAPAVGAALCRSKQGERKHTALTSGPIGGWRFEPSPEQLLSARWPCPAPPAGPGTCCRRRARRPLFCSSGPSGAGGAAGSVPGGGGRRVGLGRLVDEPPPHVDGVGGEEGPLEHVSPAEGVAAEGTADLPQAERQEGGHHETMTAWKLQARRRAQSQTFLSISRPLPSAGGEEEVVEDGSQLDADPPGCCGPRP